MDEQASQESLGWCPTCGFRGSGEVCPIDGTGLVLDTQGINTVLQRPDGDQDIVDGDAKGNITTHIDPDIGDVETLSEIPIGAQQAAHATLTGTQLNGRYRVDEVLGRGGMGTVYAGFQPAINRTVAIKVLNPEFAANPMVVRRFHQEAQTASKLAHPNTIAIHDFGESEGHLYIVMERLKGRTMKQLLRTEGPLSLERACHLIKQVLRSVAQAHRAGVIHRDIKPDNIFVTTTDGESEHVTVLDFGVAKLRTADNSDNTVTQMGSILGTPKYMAPEQTQDVPIDGRADLYSVGVILYEMLLGVVPFDGENPLAILMAHANDRPPSFETLKPDHGLHPAVQSVVMKALEKARERRYENAEALLEAVDVLEQSTRAPDERFDRKRLNRLIRAQDMKPESELDLSAELMTSRHSQRRSSRLPIAILTAVTGAIAVTLLIWMLGQQPREITNVSTSSPPDSTNEQVDTTGNRPASDVVVAKGVERGLIESRDSGAPLTPPSNRGVDNRTDKPNTRQVQADSSGSKEQKRNRRRKQTRRSKQERFSPPQADSPQKDKEVSGRESNGLSREIKKDRRPVDRAVDVESPMEFE